MQKNVEQSVCAAQQGEAKAFAALVHHFQDLAVGYAFGLLGDFHLAQDAAQDAFLEVHRTLADLRDPAAFPAWFRKIVFKHCDRRLRRKRLATVPAEDGDIASGQADPGQILERREMQRHVQKEIEHLPESERQVITLFYLAGHIQPQIADLLELPLTTIKKRLYSARQRLKKSMVDAVEEYFAAHRPSRATVFKTGVLNMIDAVTRGDIPRDTAEYPLAHGAQLDIFSAIALGKKHKIAQMLASNPSTLRQTMSRNEHFRTPLHFAVEKWEIETVDLLLERGADPTAPDATGAPALSILGVPPLSLLGAPEQAAFPPPSEQLKSDMIARLSLAGVEIDLYSAVTLEFYDRAEELLTSAPERIQPKGREHRILHFATISNQPTALRWLLEHGAAPNAKAEIRSCNATPLHFAAEHGLVEAAQELLKAASDLTITDDKFNATPLGWAQHCNQP
jgi:RNA polymerase sigma factor (sigma-70 family)